MALVIQQEYDIFLDARATSKFNVHVFFFHVELVLATQSASLILKDMSPKTTAGEA